MSEKKTHRAVIAVLASLKTGMAWPPLPLNAPPSRIDQIFRACDMGLVLSSKDTASSVPNMTHWIDIDEILASSELQALDAINLEGLTKAPMTCATFCLSWARLAPLKA